ncbi:MAG TPA: low affinity iron permease family protein [Chloroflexota bacterium]|nr:low affinity iron permease family protein [Chloroflexota bacterium]
MRELRAWLSRTAAWVGAGTASVWTALVAVVLAAAWVVVWVTNGFPQRWEALLEVVTALTTFVMVFVLQNAQERDTRAIQLKLDELLRAVEGARHEHLIGVEEKDEHEVEELQARLTREAEVRR